MFDNLGVGGYNPFLNDANGGGNVLARWRHCFADLMIEPQQKIPHEGGNGELPTSQQQIAATKKTTI